MRGPQADVAIVGAGAAGLYAARLLAERGLKVIVLEARERVGGRIRSLRAPTLPTAMELGAEFVHGTFAALSRLLAEGGTTTVEMPEEGSWTLEGGALQPRSVDWDAVGALLGRARQAPADLSVAALLHAADEDPRTRAAAAAMVEGFDAADPARASAHAIAEEWFSDAGIGGTQSRPLGGYPPLLAALERALAVGRVGLRLGTVVRAVAWQRGEVRLAGERFGEAFELRARAALVTVPTGVLQAAPSEPAGIAFAPALPTATIASLRALPMGPVLKVALRFTTPFWEELEDGRYASAAFFRNESAAFPTLWTQRPLRAPFLCAWAGGPRADALRRLDDGALKVRALDAVRALFPTAPLDELLAGAYLHDWQRDPFARGAYSYVAVDGADAREQLGEPLDDAVFFAGEATATGGYAGTVAGALQSAERAAAQIARSLG